MAVAISYAKAFRVKNQVINIIEQYQYSGTDKDNNVIELIDKYLTSVAYSYGSNSSVITNCKNTGGKLTENGACIVSKTSNSSTYYVVITYISIDFPFFDIHMIVPISGETKIISV